MAGRQKSTPHTKLTMSVLIGDHAGTFQTYFSVAKSTVLFSGDGGFVGLFNGGRIGTALHCLTSILFP